MASDLHQTRSDHWEAVRLAWKSLHIPVGTLLIGGLLLAGILSAVAMVWELGPVNPVP
jgi:hypothetical protein